MRAGIALGSNLGDRSALLNQGIGHLREIHESGDFLLSGFYETAPMDCAPGTPSFLNAVAEIGTSLTPLELLHRLQAEEIRSGRLGSAGCWMLRHRSGARRGVSSGDHY